MSLLFKLYSVILSFWEATNVQESRWYLMPYSFFPCGLW